MSRVTLSQAIQKLQEQQQPSECDTGEGLRVLDALGVTLVPTLLDSETLVPSGAARGGAWGYPETYCHAARRLLSVPTSRGYDVGFRLVRSV